MRIAVTGANGKLGRAVVVAAVAAGHEVVALDRATTRPARLPSGFPTEIPVDVHPVDVTDYDSLRGQLDGCEALVHLAAIPGPFGLADHAVHTNNVVGSYNAMLAAAEAGIGRVASASSINAIGGIYSRNPRYDYFPVDEQHPTYAEDAYSLSKWESEQQADAMVRRYPDLVIASLRFHGITPEPPVRAVQPDDRLAFEAKHLWGWVGLDASADACLRALTADFSGHEVFFVVAPTTTSALSSEELHQRFYPDVPVRRPFADHLGFYDCGKAVKLLGWVHDH
ncbi:NAD-dependent epimerase/dehydratase family protein [Actinopolymorpha alba]|uniref:NAD-dependent epimerase/dehydratase family protein n=1 Tax=Actinopolymorpha alba TaxID=533267 RepID=UPI000369D3A8|nr:NAD(P)-dependent oxidoreductase [Actinopolymorpha alba]